MRNLILLALTIIELTKLDCLNINILSKESAFIKYSNQSNIKEIIYSQPLEDKINLSVSFAYLKTTKELERSKFVSNVYTDNQVLSIQSNLNKESFTINSICKFDHDNLAAFALDKICCEITLKNPRNFERILNRKFCKLEMSEASSACFTEMEISKDNFDFQKNDEFELEFNSRVFTSQDPKCLPNSTVKDNLALGYPLKLTVTQSLQVKWEILEDSKSFGELEIGVPVDSIEMSSITIFPLKLRSNYVFSNLILLCSFGADFSFYSMSFESTRFEGEYKPGSKNDVKINLAQRETFVDIGGDFTGEQLVNLRLKHANVRTYTPSHDKRKENWIRCTIAKGVIQKTKSEILPSSKEPEKKVFIKINEDNFIIVPILPKASFFSILNPIFGPIKLKEKRLKVLNVHNILDGSLIDVTAKTECKAVSNFTLKCPFDNENNHKLNQIKDPNWHVILAMMSWQKMVRIPFELWRAEDWRLIASDKILNRISKWNSYSKSTNGCKPVYQSAAGRLVARLINTVNSNRVYFGQSASDAFPLLDMTPQLSGGNIQLSNGNLKVTLKDNVINFHANSIGRTVISILDNQDQNIILDNIDVFEEAVSIIDLEVSCIHTLSINQSSNADHLPFRSIFVSSHSSRNRNESCYLQVNLLFSDGTNGDLMDYKHTNFYLDLVHSGTTVTIDNLEQYLYEPYKYSDPGQFTLHLYESKECSKALIFQKSVNIFQVKAPVSKVLSTQKPVRVFTSSTSTSTNIKSLSISTTANAITSKSGIDTESLYLSMKILIGLVCLVVFIIIINCVIKIRLRKSACLLDRQMNNCPIYGQVEKLTTSTYSPPELTNPNSVNPHPPLLPPPGPLYNSSDSSQLDLAVNATPDRFWDFSHSGDSNRDRKLPANHFQMGIQMNTISGQGNSMNFPNIFNTSRRTSPSPHSDHIEYGYYNSNSTKGSHPRANPSCQNGYNYPPNSLHDSDSLASATGSKTSSQVAVVCPPCPPLRWNNNWNSHQFPVYFPNDKDVTIDPSISQFSNEHSSQNSLTTSQSSSWEIKQPLVLPPVGFNSIDNVCEKSSGLGSLTSTQPGSDCSKKESGHPDSPKTSNYTTSH